MPRTRSCVGPTHWPPTSRTCPPPIAALSVRPPTRGRASSSSTERPARTTSRAAVSPARPAPTTITSAERGRGFLRLRRCGRATAPTAAVPTTPRRVRPSSTRAGNLVAAEAARPAVDLEPHESAAASLDAPPARQLVDEAQAVAVGVVADLGVEPRAGVEHLDADEAGLDRRRDVDLARADRVADAVGHDLGGQQRDGVLEVFVESVAHEGAAGTRGGLRSGRERQAQRRGPRQQAHDSVITVSGGRHSRCLTYRPVLAYR